MRAAFTIIYNGLHHLKHDNYAERLCKMFDYWIVVEGASENGGSTSWCKAHPGETNSTDGTIEYLNDLSKVNENLIFFTPDKKWKSKDEQVNKAIELLKTITEKCTLWQIDIDEVWDKKDLRENEVEFLLSGRKSGEVQWNQFVGKNLIAVGEWGSNWNTRVWSWEGESFISHEPPVIEGQGSSYQLKNKCNHYSYYFDTDVMFKSTWYSGHEQVYQRWQRLDNVQRFPCHISELFGRGNHIGRSKTQIQKINGSSSALSANQAIATRSNQVTEKS